MKRPDADVAFRRDKPADGLRVFVIGESSVFGFPFGPEFAFPRFVQGHLAAAMPGRTVEVVNAGVPAIGSWHARRIAEEVAGYRPDAIVVYMGHNDWALPGPGVDGNTWLARSLKRLHFYQLAVVAGHAVRTWWQGPIDVDRLSDPTDPFAAVRDRARGKATLGAQERAAIAARYEDNLRAIVAAGRSAGASVLLVGLGQNLRDFPPGASRHRPGLSPDEKARWRAAIEAADERMRAGDCRGALRELRAARRIDRRPAILHYLRGRCLDDLGRFSMARAAYQRASDLDEVPLGVPGSANRSIAAVAREAGAQFVDVPSALMAASPHGLPGSALFVDHLHPTVAGHAAIGWIVARALGASDGPDGASDAAALSAAHPDLEKYVHLGNVILYLMLGWYDRADAELSEASRQYPELAAKEAAARANVAAARARDPMPVWSDPPDAGR